MFVTATPISSMCPTSASVGAARSPPAATRANDVPSVSELDTSANAAAASRQTRAGRPRARRADASSSEMRRGGAAIGRLRIQTEAPTVTAMNLRSRTWWRARRERGGSLGA